MFELISILLKWFKPIAGLSLLIAILAAGASLTLDNYYMSNVIFSPANPNLLDRSYIFQKEGSETPIYQFGGRGDIDRVLSIGTSAEMYQYLINKYNLYDHYEISATAKQREYKVLKELQDLYVIIKNDLGGVEIRVLDKDPQFAANMANEIGAKIDEWNRKMIFEKKTGIIEILDKSIKSTNKLINSLQDSVQNVLQRNPKDTIKSNLIIQRLETEVEESQNASISRSQIDYLVQQDISTLFYFEKAAPAIRKYKPRRSFLVIGSFIFSFLGLCFLAVFVEKYREYKTD